MLSPSPEPDLIDLIVHPKRDGDQFAAGDELGPVTALVGLPRLLQEYLCRVEVYEVVVIVGAPSHAFVRPDIDFTRPLKAGLASFQCEFSQPL